VDIKEAFEQSLAELEAAELDSTSLDILDETVEKTEDETPEDEAVESDEVQEDEESLEDEEPSEDENADDNIIQITPDAKLELPDGTIVSAEKAVLMQADYTRKTQELAEQRKSFETEQQSFEQQKQEVNTLYEQMQTWYESRVNEPSSWIAEIASETEDATATVAKAIYEMAQAGVLDEHFVETFGIDTGEIAEIVNRSKVEDEIAELRNWKQNQENEVKQREAIRQRAQKYDQEWEQVKLQRGLDFSTRIDELSTKQELFQFAFENKITQSLLDAYDLMTVRKPTNAPVRGGKTPNPEVVAKKRASRAVTPKSASSNSSAGKKKFTDRDAILAAMEDVGL
jgi:hypothetical protein